MGYILDNHFGKIVVGGLIILLATFVWAEHDESKQREINFQSDLKLAKTSAETLQVVLSYRNRPVSNTTVVPMPVIISR